MQAQEFIPIDLFCRHHCIAVSFITSLQEFGLIETTKINEVESIPVSQLVETEKLIRLHTELAINLEGIDAITHLLYRIRIMQEEIFSLKNTLDLYNHRG